MASKSKRKRVRARQASRAGAPLRRGTRPAARGRGARSFARRLPRSVIWWLAVLLAGVVLGVVSLAYDGRLLAPFYLCREAPLLPLAICLALLLIVKARPGLRTVHVDLLDVGVAAFAAWQLLAAVVSPSPWLALFGYYNRGDGAVFWLALALAFIAARRLLASEPSRRALVWVVACIVLLAGLVAVAQAAGARSLWGDVAGADRLTGTTGNPIVLGGLGLLAVWLGAALPRWRRFSPTWWAAVAGTCGGLLAVVLSVSRAALLAALVCAVVLAVVWLRRRRRAALLALAALAAAVAVVAAVHAAGPGSSVLSRLRAADGGLTGSDDKRVELWTEALHGIAARPLAGVGPGAFVIVDRLHRPLERRVTDAWAFSSDPHSLPLDVAAGSGLVGLALGAFAAAALVAKLRRRARPRGEADGEEDGTAAGAASLYLLAAAVYLLVSPVEAVVLVPAALLAGAACGPPAAGRGSWSLEPVPSRAGACIVCGAAVAVAVAGLALTSWAGVRWYRADLAFGAFSRGGPVSDAVRAADLWRYEPFYALEAGARLWREGLDGDDAALSQGEALVRRGVAADRTGPLGYADLARLDIARSDARAAVGELRLGLRWNPQQPVLQGLWGYAALAEETAFRDAAGGGELLASLERLPADTPDGWYWVSQARKARGDRAGARAARARAQRLAPWLTPAKYARRLQKG